MLAYLGAHDNIRAAAELQTALQTCTLGTSGRRKPTRREGGATDAASRRRGYSTEGTVQRVLCRGYCAEGTVQRVECRG